MMEYSITHNFNDTKATVAISRFFPSEGSPEAHAIISLPEHLAAEADGFQQTEILGKAADKLCRQMASDGLRPVMARWLLSDAANLAPALPTIGDGLVAVSIVEQPPLNATKGALWIYFIAADKPEALEGNIIKCRRGNYCHFFSGSMAIPGFGSETATAALLEDYDIRLKSLGTSLADGCIRTWFFVRDVDSLYAGVVRGRNEVFEAVGLTPQTHFIASTGIGGGAESPDITVKMDAWSVKGLRPEQIEYIQAPDHLNPTYEYGVAFERATAVDYGDRRHVIVSGTASIDSQGKIVCPGDIVGQTNRMLENVEALLANAGLGFEDVAHMIIYLRDIADNRRVAGIFEERFPEASSAPRVILRAPVCRPGWLIEMECMAVKAVDNSAYEPF